MIQENIRKFLKDTTIRYNILEKKKYRNNEKNNNNNKRRRKD